MGSKAQKSLIPSSMSEGNLPVRFNLHTVSLNTMILCVMMILVAVC